MTATSQHRADAELIASIGPHLRVVPASPSLGDIAAYVQALKDHDWEFSYTDDHSVYQRGHNSLAKIKRLQKLVDPDGTLWNTVAPDAYRLLVVEAGEVL
jgi:hypothetical protein